MAAATIAAVPMATGFAFDSGETIENEADASLLETAGVDLDMNRDAIVEPVIELDDDIVAGENLPEADAEIETAINDTVDEDLICLAKIVRHEAANQSMTGQIAVAQLVMNRVHSPRFPNTICEVAHQRGQFFNTRAYHPSREDQRWANAMEAAIDARNGISDPVVGDAVFYHAAYAYSRFHAGRPRVTQIEDHIFYR